VLSDSFGDNKIYFGVDFDFVVLGTVKMQSQPTGVSVGGNHG